MRLMGDFLATVGAVVICVLIHVHHRRNTDETNANQAADEGGQPAYIMSECSIIWWQSVLGYGSYMVVLESS